MNPNWSDSFQPQEGAGLLSDDSLMIALYVHCSHLIVWVFMFNMNHFNAGRQEVLSH